MNKQFGNDDPELADYAARVYAPEDTALLEIRARSARDGLPDIQVAAMDARHLEVLARAAGARRALEIGTLGGYSGVSLLRGMGADGELDTIELKPKHAEIARESFRRCGFEARARVHVGRALEVLPTLVSRAPFDLVFIDADKESYPAYLAFAAEHLRAGGLVVADNAFLFGRLVDPPAGEHATEIAAMQTFHRELAQGGRFRATVIPTGEGLAVGVKL